MKIADFNIGVRLGASFGVIVLIMIVLSVTSGHMVSLMHEQVDDIVLTNNVKTELNHTLAEQVNTVSRRIRNVMVLSDAQARQHEIDGIRETRAVYDRARAELEKMPAGEAARALRLRMDAARDLARPLNDQVIALSQQNRNEDAVALLLDQAVPAVEQWQAVLQEEIALQQQRTQQDYEEASAEYRLTRNTLIAGNLLGILIAGLLGWQMTRSVTRPLARTEASLERLSQGDLTVTLTAEGRDETARLMRALGRMKENLTHTIKQVRLCAESVATGSEQIASDTYAMSQRTTEQASALEETAASMEQLGSTVQQNADHIKQANRLALDAADVAARGGEVVGQAVDTMRGINDSSRKIEAIIEVIDGIAFQTNILALNAAGEAARAGEQGRGFAVVAREVRTLAQRSAAAAKEIKDLITASVERVEQGTDLVDRAGHTMADVVASIKNVTLLMHDIAVASEEQRSNVLQISTAVMELDAVTHQNAAFVEESAAATDHLKQQAQELVESIHIFKLS